MFLFKILAPGSVFGAVLLQIQNDVEKAISYRSYILTPT